MPDTPRIATFEELWQYSPRLARPGAALSTEQLGALSLPLGTGEDRNLFRLPRNGTAWRELVTARVRELTGDASLTTWALALPRLKEALAESIAQIEADDGAIERGAVEGERLRLAVKLKDEDSPIHHTAPHQALCNAFPRQVFVDLATHQPVVEDAAQLYDRLEQIVKGAGFPWDQDRVHVVAMRAYQDGRVNANWGWGHYDNRFNDTFFVAWRSAGVSHVWEVLATTDPGGAAGTRTTPDTEPFSEMTYGFGATQQLCCRYARGVASSSKAARRTHGPRPGAGPEAQGGVERRHCIDLDWTGREGTTPGPSFDYPSRLRLADPNDLTSQTVSIELAPREKGQPANARRYAANVPATHPHVAGAPDEHLFSSLRYHGKMKVRARRAGSAEDASNPERPWSEWIGQRRANNALHSSGSLGKRGDDWVRGDSMGCLVVHADWYARFCMEIDRGLAAQKAAGHDAEDEFVVTILDARDLLARVRSGALLLTFQDDDDESPEQRRLRVALDALREERFDALKELLEEADVALSGAAPETLPAAAQRWSELRDALDALSSGLERLQAQMDRIEDAGEAVEALGELLDAARAFDAVMDPANPAYAPSSMTTKAQTFTQLASVASTLVGELPLPDSLTESFALLVDSGTALLEAAADIFQSYVNRVNQASLGEGSVSTGRGIGATSLPPTRQMDYYFRKLGADVLLVMGENTEVSLALRADARRLGESLMAGCESQARAVGPSYIGEDYSLAMQRAWMNIYVLLGCQTEQRWFQEGLIGDVARWLGRIGRDQAELLAPGSDGLFGLWLDAQVAENKGQAPLRDWANPMRILMQYADRLLTDADELRDAIHSFETGPDGALTPEDLDRSIDDPALALGHAALYRLLELPIRRMQVSSRLCPIDTLLTTVSP